MFSVSIAVAAFGVRHVGSSHTTPVKLLIRMPFFSQRLHGFPLRSRARKPALIAPRFALGPSLCVMRGAVLEKVPFAAIAL